MIQEERRRLSEEEKREQREIMKEGIQEWLNARFAEFGRWTFYGLMAAAFAGVVYLILIGQGWHK